MNDSIKLAIASAALTFALAANVNQSAAIAHDGRPAWAVVRVSVSNGGDVEGMRIAYQSGDRSFDRAALQAVSKTTFAPSSNRAKAATFDYLLMTDASGKRTARIMPALPGDSEVSPTATVGIRATNPWTSGNVVARGV